MATLAELAGQAEFQLGVLEVSPSRRMLTGPAGTTNLEPIIMQALLVLAEGRGSVVTRENLFNQCWGNAAVGDDSLNRAIAKVRRALDQVAPEAFEVETIPRTGYRLIARSDAKTPSSKLASASKAQRLLSRRGMIGGAVVLAASAGGLWFVNRTRPDPRFEALMKQGDEAFRNGSAFEWSTMIPNKSVAMVKLYEQAVRIEPDNARAWGLLAFFRGVNAQGAKSGQTAPALQSTMQAVDRALALDPTEPNARVGRFLVDSRMLDWATRDRQLRAILKTDPRNVPAMLELMPLLQAAGLTRESREWNERILAVSPMARQHLVARAMKLWILGRTRESDNVIDRVRGIWPDYGFAYSVRMMLFGLTNRPAAALAMLDSQPDKLAGHRGPSIWRDALTALDQGTPAARLRARQTLMTMAAQGKPGGVNDIVMLLGALGMIEEAFEVADGYLLWRGRLVTQQHADGREIDTHNRRMTQWLFTPTLANMRADPRFERLCQEFGLTAYWRARGVQPDYLRYG